MLDIGDIFTAAITLPGQTPAETELAAEANGYNGADIGELHVNLRAFYAQHEDAFAAGLRACEAQTKAYVRLLALQCVKLTSRFVSRAGAKVSEYRSVHTRYVMGVRECRDRG